MPTKHLYSRRRRKVEKSDYTKDNTIKWAMLLMLLVATYIIIQTLSSKSNYTITVEPEKDVVKEQVMKDALPF